MSLNVSEVSRDCKLLHSNRLMAALWILGRLSGYAKTLDPSLVQGIEMMSPHAFRPDMIASPRYKRNVMQAHLSDGQRSLDMEAAKQIAMVTLRTTSPQLVERLLQAYKSLPSVQKLPGMYRDAKQVDKREQYEQNLSKSVAEVIKVINTVFQV